MIITEKITKFIDLEKNDGLSGWDGYAAQQHHDAFQVFYNFIKEVKPKRILEIGTALGGFTTFLKKAIDELNLDTEIMSFDIYERPWYKDMIDLGIDVIVEDIFDFKTSSVKKGVIDFIQKDGITIVLCDGGYKIGEFNLLSNYLKVGDFILAHDYAENKENFEEKIKLKIWNWHEIQFSDIKEACEKNNLDNFQKEIFENVVWTCRIKN
jgi:uncharacterized UPF0146 family protein